jgi:single-strand DNA-binding protein
MLLSGKLTVIDEIKTFGTKFTKRNFVIVTDEKYPQSIQLELHGETVSMLDRHKIGTELECEVNVRGRAWESPSGETKYFNTLVCWRMKLIGGNEDTSDVVVEEGIPF